MIDHLEILLESLEQEENGQAQEWKGPLHLRQANIQAHLKDAVSGVISPDNEQTQMQTKEARSVAQEILAQQKKASYEKKEAVWERHPAPSLEQHSHPAVLPLAAEIKRLRRAVRQSDAQTSRRTASEIAAASASVGGLRAVGRSDPRPKDYAAIVDTVFARDARRYDGPLGLL